MPSGVGAVEVAIVEDPRKTARSLIKRGETESWELWLLYVANGGNALAWEFEAFLYEAAEPSDLDLDLLALAMEEFQAPHNILRR